jgi:hypothetical protein
MIRALRDLMGEWVGFMGDGPSDQLDDLNDEVHQRVLELTEVISRLRDDIVPAAYVNHAPTECASPWCGDSLLTANEDVLVTDDLRPFFRLGRVLGQATRGWRAYVPETRQCRLLGNALVLDRIIQNQKPPLNPLFAEACSIPIAAAINVSIIRELARLKAKSEPRKPGQCLVDILIAAGEEPHLDGLGSPEDLVFENLRRVDEVIHKGLSQVSSRTSSIKYGPRWDNNRKELWYGDVLLKKCRKDATASFAILNEFEKEEWRRRIVDPLERTGVYGGPHCLDQKNAFLSYTLDPSFGLFLRHSVSPR